MLPCGWERLDLRLPTATNLHGSKGHWSSIEKSLTHSKQSVTRRPFSGRTFKATPAYIAYAIEVERLTGLFDFVLYSSCQEYRDAIFANAKRKPKAVA